jgi:hypothetical protein
VLQTFNILHLVVVLGAAGCIWLSLPEARGRSMKPARLFAVPLLAGLTALVLLLFALSEPLPRRATAAAFVLGLATGALRGWLMKLRVDQVLTRLRLPGGREGVGLPVAVGRGLLRAAGRRPRPRLRVVFPSAAAIAGATYLLTRALVLSLRIRYSPHHDFR